MAQKRGKGGYGSENYDPETGKYIKEGDNTYHAGVRMSVADLVEALKSGSLDDPENELFPSQAWANDNDEELDEDEEVWNLKNQIVSYFQQAYDDAYTSEMILDTDYPEISYQEFRQYGQECKNATSVRDRAGFQWYRGNSSSFEFNKALRKGLDQFYQEQPRLLNSWELNPQAIAEHVQQMDNLTNAWEFPENKKVFRYVDSGALVSWFGDTGIFDGMPMITEFEYKKLKWGSYDIHDLAKRLSTLVGVVVPPDGSFNSFSCLPNNSHMKKNWDRDVLIRYNVRAGTKAFISDYEYESEGLFNRTTGFFIQGVSVEKVNSREVVVLEYGII